LGDIFNFFWIIYTFIASIIGFIVSTFSTMTIVIGQIVTSIFSFIDYIPTQIQPLITVGLTIFSSLIILGIIRFVIKLGGR
jgi:hypothetical protein